MSGNQFTSTRKTYPHQATGRCAVTYRAGRPVREKSGMNVTIQVHFKLRNVSPKKKFRGNCCTALLWRLRQAIEDCGEGPMTYKHVDISYSPLDIQRWGFIQYVDPPQNKGTEGECRVGTSADMQNGIYIQKRMYSNQGYYSLSLEVDEVDAKAAFEYALWVVRTKRAGFFFPITQLYIAPVPPDYDNFFCTQYITTVLQNMGLLQGMNPSALTADDIKARLRQHCKPTAAETPYSGVHEKNLRKGRVADVDMLEAGMLDTTSHEIFF